MVLVNATFPASVETQLITASFIVCQSARSQSQMVPFLISGV